MITIHANATDKGEPLVHFWSNCVGAGRANEGLRASWQETLRKLVNDCGFRYVRFHGLFHDDMFVYREENGRPIYNFQYIDELFDRLLELNIRPFVEFGFCPADLATEKATVFWWKAHGSPPNDYDKWATLVRRTVEHWIARYGSDEVRSWYFEVWNEPNLHPFFKGTKSQYFELYKVTAQTLKKIDPKLRVGGPATSNFVPDERFAGDLEDFSAHATVTKAEDLDQLDWRPVWVEEFLDYCQREALPVDFVSCHPYPTDWALDELGNGSNYTRGASSTRQDLRRLSELVADSAYSGAEIHLTEWSSSPSPRDFSHDYLQAATYVVKSNLESLGLADSLAYWTFTDVFEEGGGGDTVFHGGFGMVNAQGIVKPTYHAYRFLHTLGDCLLSSTPGAVVTRKSGDGSVVALAYNYPAVMPLAVPTSAGSRATAEKVAAQGEPVHFELKLDGLRPGVRFSIETLDFDHGNAMRAWENMGSPEPPTREQAALLRQQAADVYTGSAAAAGSGGLELTLWLAPWSVVLVREVAALPSSA